MRGAIGLATIVLASAVAGAAPRTGPWGEDPREVPDFAPTEERRAPKIPAADELWPRLQAAQTWQRIEHALLVCHLEIGRPERGLARGLTAAMSLGRSELERADATIRLQIGGQPAIVLFGPAKHDASYVSIPNLSIKQGDRLTLGITDRRLLGDRALGRATVAWNGASPLSFVTPKWIAACVLVERKEALRLAQPWLASVDRQLDQIAAARVDRGQPELGRPSRVYAQLRGRFKALGTGEGNFRYAAGFLGWDAPEIQSRLERLRLAQARFEAGAAQEVQTLSNELVPAPLTIDGLRVSLLSTAPGVAQIRIEAEAELGCAALLATIASLQLIDDRGRFVAAMPTLTDAAGRRCAHGDSAGAALRSPLRGSLRPPIGHSAGPVRLIHHPVAGYARAAPFGAR